MGTGLSTEHHAAAWRRIVAYVIDCLVIDGWLVVVSAVVWGLRLAGVDPWSSIRSPWISQMIVIGILSLPATLYLAVTEASRRQATVGKRLLGLRVEAAGGGRARFGATLWRATWKLFVPWEIAHMVVHRVGARVQINMDAGLSLNEAMERVELTTFETSALAVVGLIIAAYVATLLTPPGRTVYDRLSGTCVVLP